MYGLPSGFDASRFVGRSLEQISFSANTIHLSFDEAVCITIESSFAHSTREHVSHAERMSVPVSESRLMQLLGESIEFAEGAADGTLILRFTNGQALACFDDTPMYEAYRIRFGDEEIVV